MQISAREAEEWAQEATEIVQAALCETRFVTARWVAETGSTNDDLAAIAAESPGEQVLLTDLQTAGRGRRNRVWKAPAGSSLMFSVLVNDVDIADGFWAVGAVSLAAAEACSEATGAQVTLKWPNDLLMQDKKLAGVLAQRNGQALIIGMGINVAWQADMPAEFAGRATSLDQHMQSLDEHEAQPGVVDRVALACDLLQRASRWLDAPPELVRQTWIDRCSTLQQQVRIEVNDGFEVGRAVDVDPSGALIVEQDGERVMFHVGDVVHLRPNNGPLTG